MLHRSFERAGIRVSIFKRLSLALSPCRRAPTLAESKRRLDETARMKRSDVAGGYFDRRIFDKLSRILATAFNASPFSREYRGWNELGARIYSASVSAAFGWTKSSLQGARRFPEDFICDPFSISGLSEGGFAPCMYHVFPSLPPSLPPSRHAACESAREEGGMRFNPGDDDYPFPSVCSSGPGSSPARGEGANGSRRAPSRLSKIDPAIRLAVSRVFPAQRR